MDETKTAIALACFTILSGAAYLLKKKKKCSRKKRRVWVRPIFQAEVRKRQSDYYNLMKEMLYSCDTEKYIQYLRMDVHQFGFLVELLKPKLQRSSQVRKLFLWRKR